MSSGRVLILGAGIAGAASAWWLAREYGREVVLLEAEDGPGRHSTGKNAAILRSAIAAAPTRRLALETATFLREPPIAFCSRGLLDARGLLVLTDIEAPAPTWATELEAAGVAEPLDEASRRRRAPFFEPLGARAHWLAGEGTIDIAALLDAYLAGARAAGARLRYGARAAEPLLDGERVRGLRLEGGEELEADALLCATGGWAPRMGAAIGAPLPLAPMKRHLFVTAPDARIDPRWPVVWDDAAGLYVRPESAGWLVSACDEALVEPERCELDPDVPPLAAEKITRHLPAWSDAAVAHGWAGIRTLAPDDVPVLGEDPRRPGWFWAAGLGGHGMTISAALGRLSAAAVARDASVREELEPFAVARFIPSESATSVSS